MKKDNVLWIYTNEHLVEIEKSLNTTPLRVLQILDAKHLELKLDNQFNITEEAKIDMTRNPEQVYVEFLSARKVYAGIGRLFDPIINHLFGTDNKDILEKFPSKITTELTNMLEKAGASVDIVENFDELENIVLYPGPAISLEEQRQKLGFDKGRAGNIASDDVIDELLKIITQHVPVDILNDMLPKSPYLRIISLHMLLNSLGYSPDKGLANPNRLQSILSDGAHIATAAYCHVLITRDKRMAKKAAAIYSYLNIGTKVKLLELNN